MSLGPPQLGSCLHLVQILLPGPSLVKSSAQHKHRRVDISVGAVGGLLSLLRVFLPTGRPEGISARPSSAAQACRLQSPGPPCRCGLAA